MKGAHSVVVLDFETTGLSPKYGDRPIEIGAVRIVNGEVTDRFQELMNPGFRISQFIEGYTGITNTMLKHAPPCEETMHRFADFIEGDNLVAHNASFDKRFLDSELKEISRTCTGQFACTMLAARRVYPDAPNHKLGTLVNYMNLLEEGTFHRALYDSEMTAHLWLTMLDDIERWFNVDPISFSLIQKLTKTPQCNVQKLLKNC
jgi:DNA polymerase-3 subunit epsilon